MTETALLRELLVSLSKLGARMFRNQTGQYRLARPNCYLCQREGRVIRSGLCVGSPDLVGWRSVTVTPGMVGQTLAVFVGIECKRPTGGRLSAEQRAFLAALQAAGGIAAVVRSVEEAADVLRA